MPLPYSEPFKSTLMAHRICLWHVFLNGPLRISIPPSLRGLAFAWMCVSSTFFPQGLCICGVLAQNSWLSPFIESVLLRLSHPACLQAFLLLLKYWSILMHTVCLPRMLTLEGRDLVCFSHCHIHITVLSPYLAHICWVLAHICQNPANIWHIFDLWDRVILVGLPNVSSTSLAHVLWLSFALMISPGRVFGYVCVYAYMHLHVKNYTNKSTTFVWFFENGNRHCCKFRKPISLRIEELRPSALKTFSIALGQLSGMPSCCPVLFCSHTGDGLPGLPQCWGWILKQDSAWAGGYRSCDILT